MFPLDPDVGRTRITSSIATVRRSLFHDDVVERDGRCVMTGMYPAACDAVHLLAHSKGDKVCHGILYSQSVLLTIVHCGLYSAPQSRPYWR